MKIFLSTNSARWKEVIDMKNIKYLVMDVDGTLTDGKIYIGEHGELFKAFDIKDGYGIHSLLKQNGITPIIITGRESTIVQKRCDELGIDEVYQGVSNKVDRMKQVVTDLSFVAYIGDDLNDLPSIRAVNDAGGITGCPKDAIADVRNNVTFVANYNGGYGAVREFIDWIIN